MDHIDDGEAGENDEPEPQEDVDFLVEYVDWKDALGVMPLDVTAGPVLWDHT